MDDRQVQAALTRALREVGNPSGLMRTLANQQYRSTVENFEAESFDGRHWPALKPRTAAQFLTGTPGQRASRARAGGRGRTKERGKRRGYANMLRPNGKLIFQRIHQRHTQTEAIVEVANPWAFVHNFGAPMKHFRMPRRQFLGFSRQDLANIVEAAKRWMIRSVVP